MPLRLVLLTLALSIAACAQQPPPVPFHCAQDSDIDTLRRAVIENTATQFLQTVIAGDPGSAWDSMTTDARQAITRQQFVSIVSLGVTSAEPRNLTLKHTFLLHVIGTPPPDTRVTCGEYPTDPANSYSMAVVAAPEQAYTLYAADTPNYALALTLWLVRDDTGWHVNDFAFNQATLAGRNAQQLWELAHREHQQGHDFNATLLYLATAQIANRGPDFAFGFAPQIVAEQATVTRPKEISGKPPFTFEDHGKSFTIRTIGPSDAGGRLFLAVTHEVPPWTSPKQPDKLNRDLIAVIKRLWAEYSSAFEGLIIQAAERTTGRTYLTVDDALSAR